MSDGRKCACCSCDLTNKDVTVTDQDGQVYCLNCAVLESIE